MYQKVPITVEVIKYDPESKGHNKFWTKSRITFIGDADKTLEKELYKDKPDEKVLKKYGLKSEYLHKDDLCINNFKCDLDLHNEEAEKKVGGELFNMGEIEDLIKGNDIVEEDYVEDVPKVKKFINKMTRKQKIVHEFIKKSIYPEDTVMDFKNKIYLETDIPPYKQHIFYSTECVDCSRKDVEYKHLGYNIYSNVAIIPNLIKDYINPMDLEIYNGILIDQKQFNNRDNIMVDSLDDFISMGGFMDSGLPPQGPSNIFTNHPIISKFYVISVDEFLGANKSHFNSLGDIQKNTIYYSLVIKYFPMMTLNIYNMYLVDETTIKQVYPKIHQTQAYLLNIYEKQNKFLESCNSFHDENNKDTNNFLELFNISLVNTQLVVSPIFKDRINLREIFDNLIMDKTTIMATMVLSTPERMEISKVYNKIGNPAKYNIRFNKTLSSIQIIILLPEFHISDKIHLKYENILFDKHNYIKLLLNDDKTYKIIAEWKISLEYDYDDIFEICRELTTPIISHIGWDTMTKENTKFNKLGVNILWKKNVQESFFKSLRNTILDDVIPINILSLGDRGGVIMNEGERSNIYTYYLKKGIYVHDYNVIRNTVYFNNGYEHLIQTTDVHTKYEQYFNKSKKCEIQHRYSDIMITMLNIDEKELEYNYRYISYIIFMIYKSISGTATGNLKNNKSIKGLQEIDPELYKYRGKDSKSSYSVICQKPTQPILLTEKDFKELKNAKTEMENGKIQKYKNISTGDTVYYRCPSAKYPFLKFLTGRHPRNYCIPCCQKKEADSMNESRKFKHNTCLKFQKFDEKDQDIFIKTNVEDKSLFSLHRHIIAYTKNIPLNRFSHLPDTSLQMLFYDNYSQEYKGIEEECVNFDNISYLLYGCQQNTTQMSGVGMFYLLVHALNLTGSALINLIKSKLNNDYFHLLLNGNIYRYYNNSKELITDFINVFINNGFSNFNDWNNLLLDILKYYIKIRPILFEDKGKVELILPNFITNPREFIDMDELSTEKYIIILKNDIGIYPIYIVNTSEIKTVSNNDGAIMTRIYTVKDLIIEILYGIVVDSISSKYKKLNIFVLLEHINSLKSYKLKAIFINSDSMCYGCKISSDDGIFYIPLEFSTFNIRLIEKVVGNLDIILDVIDYNNLNKNSLEETIKFIGVYNEHIKKISRLHNSYKLSLDINKNQEVIPILDYIIPEKLLIFNEKCIGFISNGMNYYCYPVSIQIAEKIVGGKEGEVPIYEMEFDPIKVNKVLYKKTKPNKDYYMDNIDNAIYNKYLYQLLIMEVFLFMSRERNIHMRTKLLKIIKKITNIKTLNSNIDKLEELAPYDVNYIKDIILKYQIGKNKYNGKSGFDGIKKIFEKNQFRFDTTYIKTIQNNLKELDYNKRIDLNLKLLKEILPKVISISNKIGADTDIKMPNILKTCSNSNEDYCKGNKLIVHKKFLDDLTNALAMELSNTFTANTIYYLPFVNNIINILRFSKHENEEIYTKYL